MKQKIYIAALSLIIGYTFAIVSFPIGFVQINNPVIAISRNADKCLNIEKGSYTYEAFTIQGEQLYKESCDINRSIDYRRK